MIHVVSTGFTSPTRERCILSVSAQTEAHVHHYVEASTQDPPRDVITNQASIIRELDPSDVVVLLDGDDWLASNDVLARVAYAHHMGAWVTHGSFEFSDGRPGFAAEYTDEEKLAGVRAAPWKATHLKSIRAGLFPTREEDLSWPTGAPVPWDMVVMFAAIEQAGWDRVMFLPEILYVYNFASSHEFRNGPEGERAIERLIRMRQPYERRGVL